MGEVGIVQPSTGSSCTSSAPPIGYPSLYELTPANAADVSLTEELLAEAGMVGGEEQEVARRLLGGPGLPKPRGLKEELGRGGDRCWSPARPAAQTAQGSGSRWRSAISSLKRVFGVGRDAGHDPGGAGHQDRGEDRRPTPTRSW